jgi:hypothetical protein
MVIGRRSTAGKRYTITIIIWTCILCLLCDMTWDLAYSLCGMASVLLLWIHDTCACTQITINRVHSITTDYSMHLYSYLHGFVLYHIMLCLKLVCEFCIKVPLLWQGVYGIVCMHTMVVKITCRHNDAIYTYIIGDSITLYIQCTCTCTCRC